MPHQVLKEGDGVQAREGFRPYQDVDLPLRCQTSHDRQVVTRLPLVQDRGLTLWPVRLDHPGQQVEARFIHENQGSALPACPLPECRPGLIAPADDGILVPLDGPRNGHLRGPAEVFQDPRYLALAVEDPELLLQHLGDTGAGPNVTPEAVRLRAVPEEVGNQAALLVAELCRATGAWL